MKQAWIYLSKISVCLTNYLSDSSHPIPLCRIIKARQKTSRMDRNWARSYSDDDALSRPASDFAEIHVHFWPVRGECFLRRLCCIRTTYTNPNPYHSLNVSTNDSAFLSRLAHDDQPGIFLVFSDPTTRQCNCEIGEQRSSLMRLASVT